MKTEVNDVFWFLTYCIIYNMETSDVDADSHATKLHNFVRKMYDNSFFLMFTTGMGSLSNLCDMKGR